MRPEPGIGRMGDVSGMGGGRGGAGGMGGMGGMAGGDEHSAGSLWQSPEEDEEG
jgi:hypothetical protein